MTDGISQAYADRALEDHLEAIQKLEISFDKKPTKALARKIIKEYKSYYQRRGSNTGLVKKKIGWYLYFIEHDKLHPYNFADPTVVSTYRVVDGHYSGGEREVLSRILKNLTGYDTIAFVDSDGEVSVPINCLTCPMSRIGYSYLCPLYSKIKNLEEWGLEYHRVEYNGEHFTVHCNEGEQHYWTKTSRQYCPGYSPQGAEFRGELEKELFRLSKDKV